ncbi:MAG: diacylglycerol kinase [Polaribacter sp.]|jgi:diacylglycerol kinase
MSIKQRLNSFKYAFAGIYEVVQSQPNMKIHIVVAVLTVLSGYFFSISITEWCFIAVASLAVMSAEAFNTALEHLTDLVSPEYNPLAGKVKDAAAGGVLITAIGAAIIGLLIFLPKLLALL